MSGGVHLRGVVPDNTVPIGDTVFDLTGLGIEPETSRADSDVFNHYTTETERNFRDSFFISTFPSVITKQQPNCVKHKVYIHGTIATVFSF